MPNVIHLAAVSVVMYHGEPVLMYRLDSSNVWYSFPLT